MVVGSENVLPENALAGCDACRAVSGFARSRRNTGVGEKAVDGDKLGEFTRELPKCPEAADGFSIASCRSVPTVLNDVVRSVVVGLNSRAGSISKVTFLADSLLQAPPSETCKKTSTPLQNVYSSSGSISAARFLNWHPPHSTTYLKRCQRWKACVGHSEIFA